MPGKELDWLPQAALDRMHADLQRHSELTREALAERVLADAAPLAAYRIVELATDPDVDESVGLRAAQYVMDRANGRPKAQVLLNTTPDNPVMKILDGVVVERPDSTNTSPHPTIDETIYDDVPDLGLPPE